MSDPRKGSAEEWAGIVDKVRELAANGNIAYSDILLAKAILPILDASSREQATATPQFASDDEGDSDVGLELTERGQASVPSSAATPPATAHEPE